MALEELILATVVETVVEEAGQEIHLVNWAWAVAVQADIVALAVQVEVIRHSLRRGFQLVAAVAVAVAVAVEAQAIRMVRIKVGLVAVA